MSKFFISLKLLYVSSEVKWRKRCNRTPTQVITAPACTDSAPTFLLLNSCCSRFCFLQQQEFSAQIKVDTSYESLTKNKKELG
jgi:hypothetical protein